MISNNLKTANFLLWISFTLIENSFSWSSRTEQKRPNIIIFLADDLGINDVSFRGMDQFATYNIDALASNGIVLNNFYTSSLCTPSRSALLTSKFPIHTGMQHNVILEAEPWGLPLSLPLLPEYLKDVGYKTIMCGKWHLGFFEKHYTPTYRGFDEHYGYWQGYQDYYTHIVQETFGFMQGYDMRDGMHVDWDADGIYSTDYFTEKAIRAINSNEPDKPLFLLMSHLAAHSGNPSGGLKAPDDVMQRLDYIDDIDRRRLAGVVTKLDESIGSIMEALHNRGMLENSIVLFLSDNGAPTVGIHQNWGSNYPLRGMKGTELEGGVRNNAVIWSPLIKSKPRISNQLISLVDIMPTLCSAAGIDVAKLGNIDGVDMWEALSTGSNENLRTEMPHNIDTNLDGISIYGAVRVEQWKYIKGSPNFGLNDGWMGDSGRPKQGDDHYRYDPRNVLNSKVGTIINEINSSAKFRTHAGGVNSFDKYDHRKVNAAQSSLTVERIQRLRNDLTIRCPELKDLDECNPMLGSCLVNIQVDPCEKYDFSSKFPATLQIMKEKFDQYRSGIVPPLNKGADQRANPDNYNHTWVNWYDYLDGGFIDGNK